MVKNSFEERDKVWHRSLHDKMLKMFPPKRNWDKYLGLLEHRCNYPFIFLSVLLSLFPFLITAAA